MLNLYTKTPTVPWVFQYCKGMPSKPSYLKGWDFTFTAPRGSNSVNYITKPHTSPPAKSITLTVKVEQSSDAVWDFKTESFNNGTHPASVRVFLQRKNDPMTLEEKYQYYRFWSNPQHIQLRNGTQTIIVPLTASEWSSVLGARSAGGLASCCKNIGRVGVTFGGGSFFGHGVRLSKGTAKISVRYKVS